MATTDTIHRSLTPFVFSQSYQARHQAHLASAAPAVSMHRHASTRSGASVLRQDSDFVVGGRFAPLIGLDAEPAIHGPKPRAPKSKTAGRGAEVAPTTAPVAMPVPVQASQRQSEVTDSAHELAADAPITVASEPAEATEEGSDWKKQVKGALLLLLLLSARGIQMYQTLTQGRAMFNPSEGYVPGSVPTFGPTFGSGGGSAAASDGCAGGMCSLRP